MPGTWEMRHEGEAQLGDSPSFDKGVTERQASV